MFITNAWSFWRLPQYFGRLSGDLSKNKRNQMKTNENFIKFIFISFTTYYEGISIVFQVNNL